VGHGVWSCHQNISNALDDAHCIIELSPLKPEESGRLLDNLLGADALSNKIRNLIIAKSEGNPFYMEEVIRSLINQGAITRSNNGPGWVITANLDDIKLPDTLQGIIMARIDQLDPELKRVLQIASVVGKNFSYSLLERVLEKVAGA
jgi:predicted ATPase